MEDLAAMIDGAAPKSGKRGPYRKRQPQPEIQTETLPTAGRGFLHARGRRDEMRNAACIAIALALLSGAAVAAEPTLQKIKSSGEIVIGHREEARPFSFVEAGTTPTGYSVDLCLRVVEAVKAELGMPNLTVKYVPVTAENRFAKVADGSIDLECGNSTRRREHDDTEGA
jgi:Bacterial extracellular solute-binding proteins, family 3